MHLKKREQIRYTENIYVNKNLLWRTHKYEHNHFLPKEARLLVTESGQVKRYVQEIYNWTESCFNGDS